jgi:hypothetical protein
MLEGVDYSFANPNLNQLKAAGKHFIGRYLPIGSGKDLTKAEAAEIKAAGMELYLYFEVSAGWMLGGRAAGIEAAHKAAEGASACGVPMRKVYFAADTPLTENQVPTVLACLDGAASVIGKAKAGLYHSSSSSLLRHALSLGYACVEADWTGNPPIQGVKLHQYRGNVNLAGGAVDLVRALTVDYGQCWYSVPLPPKPPEGDMTDKDAQELGYASLGDWRIQEERSKAVADVLAGRAKRKGQDAAYNEQYDATKKKLG